MDLSFPKERVRALLAHSRAASERHPTFDQLYDPTLRKPGREHAIGIMGVPSTDKVDLTRILAGLWLVGDQGTYLLSHGSRDPDDLDCLGPVDAAETDPTVLDFDTW